MLQSEFTQLTGVTVSQDEFWSINEEYLHAGNLSKEDFCLVWCHHHQDRVLAAKEAAKEAAKLAAIRQKIFEALCSCFDNFDYSQGWRLTAEQYYKKSQLRKIQAVGINTTDRCAWDVHCDLMSIGYKYGMLTK